MHGFSVIGDAIWYEGYALAKLCDYGVPFSVREDAVARLNGGPSYQNPPRQFQTNKKIKGKVAR